MPASWSTGYGALVATRVAGINGGNTIEVRTVVTLPADEDTAGLAAQGLLTAVHLTIVSLTADRPAAVPTTAQPNGRHALRRLALLAGCRWQPDRFRADWARARPGRWPPGQTDDTGSALESDPVPPAHHNPRKGAVAMQPTQNTAPQAEQPSRCWDRAPETDADRRFFDLRDAGYTGWINQDGYPVTKDGLPVVVSQQCGRQTVATTLRAAARYLERFGWCQGSYYDQTAIVFTPAACVVGAIAIVSYGGPVEAPAVMFDAPGYLEFDAAVSYVEHFVTVAFGRDIYGFNDDKTTTAVEVRGTLLLAASAWDNTHGGAA